MSAGDCCPCCGRAISVHDNADRLRDALAPVTTNPMTEAIRRTLEILDTQPPGQPGSYARGHWTGIQDAMKTLQSNYAQEVRRASVTSNERTLLRDIYVELGDAKQAREAKLRNDEGASVLHAFFQLFGPRIREALGCEDTAAVRAWRPHETNGDADTITSLCDRLDRINRIAVDRVTNDSARLVMIANESEGFMPIPPCSICQKRHAEPEQNCPQLKS